MNSRIHRKLILLAALLPAGVYSYISFETLGDFPGGRFLSGATDVSANGSIVIGYGSDSSGSSATFIWDQLNGMQPLPGLDDGGISSFGATAISGDGSTVVGMGSGEAVRWDSVQGFVGLGLLRESEDYSKATSVSFDGSTVVGHSGYYYLQKWEAEVEAFRWDSENGMIGLGDLAGGIFQSFANDISWDGSVIVGQSYSGSGLEAFRWDPINGMVGLGDLDEGEVDFVAFSVTGNGAFEDGQVYTTSNVPFISEAFAVSNDGSIVVGLAQSPSGTTAFRWDAVNGMISLPDGASSRALGVSGDGSVIIGSGGIMWTEDNSFAPIDLNDFLDAQGVNRKGFIIREAEAISENGRTIVGYGRNLFGDKEAFRLDFTKPFTWAGNPIVNQFGDVDTGEWIGWINVSQAPIIWSYSLEGWMYMEEAAAEALGTWGYFYK